MKSLLAGEGGIFEHPPGVIEYAWQLVNEYNDWQAMQDRHESPMLKWWHQMRAGCSNRKSPLFSKFGGLGIRVCTRWQESYSDFAEDMGPMPDGATGITRVDNKKHFDLENTVWKF